MRVQIFLLLLATLPLNSRQTILGNGTFFGEMSDGATSGMHSFMELFAPVTRIGHSIMNFFSPRDDEEELGTTTVPTTDPLPRSSGNATTAPVEESPDELFPRDCGRTITNVTNRGNLCFPVGKLCEDRVNKGGVQRFGGHLYYFSWQDTDNRVKNAKWDWFNARNYCRKRCMDLVSFETKQEYDWVKGFVNGNVPYFWTSGRLCDFDGCDRPDFFPKNINGWFWSANQARLAPTNSQSAFHDWSATGGFQPPKPQPDNREQTQQGGDSESCLAVLNNFYGDGIKWHDVACHHEKPIICEDVEGHLAFARQTFPNIRIP